MNSSLFQNFIDAISLLTVSQINILNEALAFVAVTKAGDDDAEAMRSGCDGSQASVSAPDTPDLEHMIESRFAQYPVCNAAEVGMSSVGVSGMDDSVIVAHHANVRLPLLPIRRWQS